MAGFNYVTGDYVVSVDDDGQCPVDKLFDLMKPLSEGYDVALAKYPKKKQSAFKNFGSWLNSVMAQAMINKPKDLQISNFSVSKKFVIDEIIKYDLPYPYFSGLLLRTTRKIVNVPMEERSRKEGKSTFTFAKLVAMWMNGLTAFSVKPLRLASIIGCLYAFLGFLYGAYTIIYRLNHHALPKGYSSTMTVNMFTYGIILLMLGLMGEYLGRIYICINKSPRLRIIVPAVQIVQACLPVIPVSSVQVRVVMDQVIARGGAQHIDGCHLSPGIVLIAHHQSSGDAADDPCDVSLQVLTVQITVGATLHPYRRACLIVVVPDIRCAAGLIDHPASVQGVAVGNPVDGFRCPVSFGVIGIAYGVCQV